MKTLLSLMPRNGRSESTLAVEQLEPRVLFSAAPVDTDAPPEVEAEAGSTPAQEAPAFPQAGAEENQQPSTPTPITPRQEAEAVPSADGASEIPSDQQVALVDLDGGAEGPNHKAAEDSATSGLLLQPTDTTSVEVDGDGNLVIEDILGGDTDDKLFIGVVDGRLEIRDSRNTVGSSLEDVTAVGNRGRGVSVGLGSFTGDIIVRTLGGDDTITIGDLSGLPGGIVVEDGSGQDMIKQKGAVHLSGGADLTYLAEEIRLERRSTLTTDNGAITLEGNGNQTSDRRSTGVWANGSRIATNSGGIEITGFGGTQGGANRGVYLRNTDIASGGDDVFITGVGGGTGSGNDGVYLGRGTDIRAGGFGDVVINGVGGDAKSSNRGVYVQSGATLEVEHGQMSVTGTGGDGRSSNSGVVIGRAELKSQGPRNLLIEGTGNGSGSRNVGVSLRGTSIVHEGSGVIRILGSSDDQATGSGNTGFDLRSSRIHAHNGSVAVMGSGGNGRSSNYGTRAIRSELISDQGTVVVSGATLSTTSGSRNMAVEFKRGTISAATDVVLSGLGGNGTHSNTGLLLVSSQVNAGNDALVTGNTRETTTGASNRGVDFRNSDLSAASITVNGKGGAGINRNAALTFHRSTLIATTGNVELSGQVSVLALGSRNHGVELNSALVQSAGDTRIFGVSGSGTRHNQGVRIERTSIEAGPAADIDISGTARGRTTANWNVGVYLFNRVSMSAANLELDGTGGGGSGFNHGVFMHRRITTETGNNNIAGLEGVGETSENTAGDFFQ